MLATCSPVGLPGRQGRRPRAVVPLLPWLATLAETVVVAPATGGGAGAMAVADTLPGVTGAGASDVMAKGTFGGTPLRCAVREPSGGDDRAEHAVGCGRS